jgi:hypothetical protein
MNSFTRITQKTIISATLFNMKPYSMRVCGQCVSLKLLTTV